MTKLDPRNPIIRAMLSVIVVYVICNYLLVNVYLKDYDHDKIKDEIINVESKENLKKLMEQVHANTKLPYYFLLSTVGVLFVLYLFYKTKTAKSESIAIMFAMCLSMCGKLIEKLGLADCLKLPLIDPQGKPGNVLLFDMFYTNFFAYFIDFIYAFSIIQVGSSGVISAFKSTEFKKLLVDNLSIYSKGTFNFINIVRFLVYYLVIIVFWSWGSVLRPKVSLLVHRYVGIPVVPKEDLKKLSLKDDEYPLQEFTTDKLLFTYHTIGIIAATVVEGLIFTGVLFNMRKYVIYTLDNNSEFASNKYSVLAKFISLVIFIPVLIMFLVKYTLTDNSVNYKLEKITSLVLLQYIMVPTILFILDSLFKVPVLHTLQKHQKSSIILLTVVPIIVSMIVMYVFKYNGSRYIDEDTDKEKVLETFMSENSGEECGPNQTKFKVIVAVLTVMLSIVCFGPLAYVGKLQPLNGILLLLLLFLVLIIIYRIQKIDSPYNIVNPERKNKQGEMDLDQTESIVSIFTGIIASVLLLSIFRKYRR